MSDNADRVMVEYCRDKVAACERLVLLCMDHHEAEMLKNDELRARIAELETALRPFARYISAAASDEGVVNAEDHEIWLQTYDDVECCTVDVTAGDFHRARAALSTKEDVKG